MVGEDYDLVGEGCAPGAFFVPASGVGDDVGVGEADAAESAQFFYEDVVFHDGDVGVAGCSLEGFFFHEEGLVAVGHL